MIEDIMKRAYAARDSMAKNSRIGRFVDTTREIPVPHVGKGTIKLFVIGQDPTVKNMKSRNNLTTTLNVDRAGTLKTYLNRICKLLDISLEENVYVTNFCKAFFVEPPATIKRWQKIDVVEKSAGYWFPILNDELAQFPDALVISLGRPVLSGLVKSDFIREVRYYWGHAESEKGLPCRFRFISAEASTVGRKIYPFCHQTSSLRLSFYRKNFPGYVEFVKGEYDFHPR